MNYKMVVPENGVMCDNIMRGIEKNGGGIHLHNRKQKLKQKYKNKIKYDFLFSYR